MKIDRGNVLSGDDLAAVADYKRFLVTDSGVSPRTWPGTQGGVFKATGNEHDERGLITEDADNRAEQVDKRLRKTRSLDVSEIGTKLHGDSDADVTLVGWGSTKSVIIEAMHLMKEQRGLKCNFLQVIYMEPFPSDRVAEVVGNAKRTILVENNATGHLGNLIAAKAGHTISDMILKYNGRQFFKDELVDLIDRRL
jgi:2-oxoglutarate ferredoxin oxidoreductase subunit alpha